MSMLRRVLDRESIVKTNLTESLVECVKELQLRYSAERGALKNDESTNSLCWILEAMFIHGLKNRFLKSMSSVLTSRENQVPEPSFWEFVLVFCHQEVILQILQLPQINTDIGRCRAWLRVAINDGLLISYLQLMLTDKSTIRDYYKPSAFLRDSERCDIMKSYLYGIESYDFQLAFNSSLLNTWNTGPLSLVGLWTPTDTITQGIDVAENMDDKDLQALPTLHNQARTPPKPSFFSLENNTHSFRTPLLEEDEALRVILSSKGSTGSTSAQRSAASSRRNSDGNSPIPHLVGGTSVTVTVSATISTSGLTSDQHYPIPFPRIDISSTGSTPPSSVKHSSPLPITPQSIPSVANSMSKIKMEDHPPLLASTTTTDGSHHALIKPEMDVHRLQAKGPSPQITTPEEELSYAALFDNYTPGPEPVMGSPLTGGSFFDISPFGSSTRGHNNNLNVTTTSSDPALGSSLEENRSVSSCSTPIDILGFEIVSRSEQFSQMLPPIDAYTHRIPKETGLDTQNYKCRRCERPIGMIIYGDARVCGFTGYYYCAGCHVNDEFVIPSRILLNWDFNRYFVSKEAKDFLVELQDQPILDIQEINPKLYHHVEECAEVERLRIKLKSIAVYLKTCRKPVLEEFKKDIWPKEYLYESIHLYCLSDLLKIPDKSLAATLTKLVAFGKNHIKSCEHCLPKGFVCEVCRDKTVIFPFDLDRIFKCSSCGAVYHNSCMNSEKPCPRCERWKISAYDADLTCL